MFIYYQIIAEKCKQVCGKETFIIMMLCNRTLLVYLSSFLQVSGDPPQLRKRSYHRLTVDLCLISSCYQMYTEFIVLASVLLRVKL